MFRFAYTLLAICFMSACNANDTTPYFGNSIDCVSNVFPDNNWTVENLLKKSEYIGIYSAELIEQIPSSSNKPIVSFDNILKEKSNFEPNAKFKLQRSSILKGIPPKISEKSSYDTYSKSTRQEYFYAEKYHQNMVENDNILLGFAYFLSNEKNECELYIELTHGYRYLVFGNSNGDIFIEPIFSLTYDPFYLEVNRLLKSQR